jgi:DNA modification methylase
MNQLFFGDNLNVLRESIANESVDLIYLDPPFNSKRDYNLLFKSPKVGSSRCDDRTAQAPSPPTIPRRRSRRLKTRGIRANRRSASSTNWCTRPTPTFPR